ncbi:MAG: thiamine-phosphate kinase [Actinobacteria bacterium]|nr:thiamine-phosphate kinase [Actinomycetota bacterium]
MEPAGASHPTPPSFTEDELIAAIRRVLSGDHPGVVLGVGDDAALVEGSRPGAELVLTTDMLVEGVHFDRAVVAPRDLGYKAIVVNVSDVAAMAGSPRYALLSLGLSPGVEPAWVMELYGGIRAACDEYALSLVGGDLSRGRDVVLAVTVVGAVQSGRAVPRSGARAGDRIVVTGALGAAAGGLALTRTPPARLGDALGSDWGRELLRALDRPVARVGEAETLAQAGATAMMDLSDGLALDLHRLCRESGVGARVRLADVPVAPQVRLLAGVLDVDPLALALSGGEDYELVATLPLDGVARARSDLDERFGVALTEVGEVVEAELGYVAVRDDGSERELEPRGWDHFGTG